MDKFFVEGLASLKSLIDSVTEQSGGVTLTLTHTLHLSGSLLADNPSPDISDLVTQVDLRGPDSYSLPEGVASLVADILHHFRGTRGNLSLHRRSGKSTDLLFELRYAFNIGFTRCYVMDQRQMVYRKGSIRQKELLVYHERVERQDAQSSDHQVVVILVVVRREITTPSCVAFFHHRPSRRYADAIFHRHYSPR